MYLIMVSEFVSDTTGTPATVVVSISAQQVTELVPDTTSPTITNVAVDMDVGTLQLEFDEIVLASTVVTTDLALTNNTSVTHSLTGGIVSTANPTLSVTIDLTIDDLNEIKRLDQLAINLQTTFLAFTPAFVTDAAGNAISNTASPQAANSYVADTTDPEMVSFSLNMDTGVISMVFDETVDASTLDITSLTLQNSSTTPFAQYTLTDAAVTSADGTVQTVTISQDDLNLIKAIDSIGQSSGLSYLSFGGGMINDMASNSIVQVAGSSAFAVQTFVPDTTSPSLVDSALDMSNGTITILFSETVRIASINYATFQLGNINVGQAVLLKDTTASSINQPQVTFTLDIDVLNRVKELRQLAVSAATSQLSFSTSFIADMQGNAVVAVSTSQVDVFTADKVEPVLNTYNFNLDTRVMTLTFSETIEVTSIQPTSLTLIDSASSPTFSVTLEGGAVTLDDVTSVSITLEDSDANRIKAAFGLATSVGTTYLLWDHLFATDVVGNNVTSNTVTGLQVTNFTQETTSPTLASFTLDMDALELVLYFDETVDEATFDVSTIQLQSAASITAGTETYTLTGGDFARSNLTAIAINITKVDADNIKALSQLCISTVTTFISFSTDMVEDMAGNAVVAISSSSAKRVAQFVVDTI
jgi:hypothetical protein